MEWLLDRELTIRCATEFVAVYQKGDKKMKYKAIFALLITGGILSGCNNKATESVAQVNAAVSQLQSSVDGYRNFKFGMSPFEVGSLSECSHYKDAHQMLKGIFTEEYASLESLVSQITPSTPSNRAEELTGNVGKLKNLIATLDATTPDDLAKSCLTDAAPILGIERGQKVFIPRNGNVEIEAFCGIPRWYQCKIDFGGVGTEPELSFSKDKKLEGVTIATEYTNEKLAELTKLLSEKYTTSQTPTDAQIAYANDNPAVPVSWVFANGQVSMTVKRISGIYISYMAPQLSQKNMSDASKGITRKGDI